MSNHKTENKKSLAEIGRYFYLLTEKKGEIKLIHNIVYDCLD